MNREWVFETMREQFSTEPDYPFPGDDSSAVFRHTDNRKWFALMMRVPRRVLGLTGENSIDILNVKCDPFLSGSFRGNTGILPAYHMNKSSWITVLLDGTVEPSQIVTLIGISYDLTARKTKRRIRTDG